VHGMKQAGGRKVWLAMLHLQQMTSQALLSLPMRPFLRPPIVDFSKVLLKALQNRCVFQSSTDADRMLATSFAAVVYLLPFWGILAG